MIKITNEPSKRSTQGFLPQIKFGVSYLFIAYNDLQNLSIAQNYFTQCVALHIVNYSGCSLDWGDLGSYLTRSVIRIWKLGRPLEVWIVIIMISL